MIVPLDVTHFLSFFHLILSFFESWAGTTTCYFFQLSLPALWVSYMSDSLYYFQCLGRDVVPASTTSLCLTPVYDALGYRASSSTPVVGWAFMLARRALYW